MSFIALLSIAATAPIVAAPPPPPILIAPTSPGRPIGPPVTFDVDIRLGNEVLWSGPMRVSQGAAAQFTRTKSDAPAVQCTDAALRYVSSDVTSLSVRLSRQASPQGEDRFQLTANWSRPGGENGCPNEQGTRTIGLTQSFVLSANSDLTVAGDGGLSIRLRRR